MRDVTKLKDYRTKYKRYFGIDFDENYVVHHIDLNRNNNDIDNLLLLPKELHAKYHFILNAISISPEKPKADGIIDVRLSNCLITDYGFTIFKMLPETIEECNKWYKWKLDRYSEQGKLFIFG